MYEAALLDVWKTSNRKVYAEGARVCETSLKRPPSVILDNGSASLKIPNSRKARRKMYRRLKYGALRGFGPLCMDSNDPQTLEFAFRKRLFRDVPDASKEELGLLANYVDDFLHKYVPVVTPMDFEVWLNTTSYNEARKAELRDAHNLLRGAPPSKRQCSHIDTFPKLEPYEEFKHARMINSRCDAFKVFSGPCFKAIENVIYDLPWFMKHVPHDEKAARVADLIRSGSHYYQTDFTAFESHFTMDVMKALEIRLYEHCLSGFKDTSVLTSALLGRNKMRTRTGLRATCVARRMSGDMCTSLGNGFTNLMLALFIVESKKNGKLRGFVEGDDGLFSTTVPLTTSDYESLGFTIKIEEVANPCEASFCGLVFASSGEIVRDPVRFLNRFGWTSSFINAGPLVMDELLRAKALSAAYETPQCPIVGVIARHAIHLTTGVTPRFTEDGYHERVPVDFQVPQFAPSTDTRLLFEHLYGVSVQNQLTAEAQILNGNLDCLLDLLHPHVDVSRYCRDYIVAT